MPAKQGRIIYFLTFLFATLFVIKFILPSFAETDPTTIKFRDFYPPTVTNTPSPTPYGFKTPTNTPVPPVSQTTPTIIPGSRKIYFSQRDPRWIDYNPDTNGDLGRCGCGETSVAMILASYFDTSFDPSVSAYNPARMWDYYETIAPGRCGTNWITNQQVLGRFGLQVSEEKGYDPFTGPKVLSSYLQAGYKVMIYYDRPWSSVGHYVLLDQVVGTDLVVFDPYPFTRDPFTGDTSQPNVIEGGVNVKSYITIRKP